MGFSLSFPAARYFTREVFRPTVAIVAAEKLKSSRGKHEPQFILRDKLDAIPRNKKHA
jgi:hypothetical protein